MSPASLFRELAKLYGLYPALPVLKGVYWARVVEMLSDATKMDLTVLTGHRWSRVRKDRLYRSTHAWCPHCIAELDLHHHPLLWQFAAVTACHRHGTPLISRCPGCHRQISSVSGLGDYHCQRCGFDVRQSSAIAGAPEKDIRAAGLVAELVSSSQKYGEANIERRGDGRGQALRLTRLLDVCREDGTTLVELLKSDSALDALVVRRPKLVSVVSTYESRFEAYKLRQSRELDIFTLDQIQTEFGVSYRTARKWQADTVPKSKRSRGPKSPTLRRQLKKLLWYREVVNRELNLLVDCGAARDAASLHEAERRVVAQRRVVFSRAKMLGIARECLVSMLAMKGVS